MNICLSHDYDSGPADSRWSRGESGPGMFSPGDEITLTVPRSRDVRNWHRRGREQVQLVVDRIRDLVSVPLEVDQFLRRPYLLRSRWLVRGYDLENECWRSLYLGASREFPAPGALKVGIYEAGDLRPYRVFGRPFEPTTKDRDSLIAVLQRVTCRDFGSARLCIFADDLNIVGAPVEEGCEQ